MTSGMNTIIYPVDDLAAAKALYTALLGVEPYTDQPYYVGFRVGEQELGLDPNGHKQGLSGAVAYWSVDDVEGTVKTLTDAGAEVLVPARDVGGGLLVATLRDTDGNLIGLRSA